MSVRGVVVLLIVAWGALLLPMLPITIRAPRWYWRIKARRALRHTQGRSVCAEPFPEEDGQCWGT